MIVAETDASVLSSSTFNECWLLLFVLKDAIAAIIVGNLPLSLLLLIITINTLVSFNVLCLICFSWFSILY